MKSTGAALVAIAFVWAATAHAAVYRATPADYQAKLALLEPGDTLWLSAGEYRNGLTFRDTGGTPGRPVIVQGVPGTVFHARAEQSTVRLIGASHLVIRTLDLEGDNLPVDAVKAERGSATGVHDITLENLIIRGHGHSQQTVGISSKCPAWNWVIRGNRIIGAGTGIYLGDSDGSAPFVAGTIEYNLIVDTIGYNLQIKHQLPRPDLAGLPTQPSTTVIRHNVFVKAHQVPAPDGPRPNVLVGHFPLSGPGADDRYAIYGNFFYQNAQEALFQGEGNVALYDNVFVNTYGKDAVHIQPHNDIPRHVTIAFNTVIAKNEGISITNKPGSPEFPQKVIANAVFAGTPIVGGSQSNNVTGALADASTFLRNPLAAPGKLDLVPRRPLLASSKIEDAEWLPDWHLDFDGRERPPRTIGAYGAAGRNPAWRPRVAPKPASHTR